MSSNQREDLKDIFDKAMAEGLERSDIDGLTLYTKCDVIHGLVGALRDKVPQRTHGSGRTTRNSLTAIVGTFEASDNLLEFQDHRRKRFLGRMERPENRHVLKAISGWDQFDQTVEKKAAITHATQLHQQVYLSGVADIVPIDYMFKDAIKTQTSRHNIIVVGGFRGNLSTGEASIRQDTSRHSGFHDPREAFHTGHHEMTHGIQFALAKAFHHNRIRPDNPLYEDARMFHAIELNMAVIPCSILKASDQRAYNQQMHEVMADREGIAISDALMDLSQ